jgi:hypothetical protein
MRHINHIGIFWQGEISAIGTARLGQRLDNEGMSLLEQRASKISMRGLQVRTVM